MLTHSTVFRTLSALLRARGGGVALDEHTETALIQMISQIMESRRRGRVSADTMDLGVAFSTLAAPARAALEAMGLIPPYVS